MQINNYDGEKLNVPQDFITNNNNVHLSCAHQRPERSHDTY